MAFENLSEKISAAFKKLKSKGKLTENDVKKLGYKYDAIAEGYRIYVKNTLEAKKLIIDNSNLFDDFEITKGKMDDVFLNVTGKKLVGGN